MSIEKILELAYEVRDEIFEPGSNLSSILRKCWTISLLIGRREDWITSELNGYEDKTIGELLKTLPEYRISMVMLRDYNNRRMSVPNYILSLLNYPIILSISEIENYADDGLVLRGGLISTLREKLEVPIKDGEISAIAVKRIIETVKNKSLLFVNNIIIELEYDNIISDIFNEYKDIVDKEMINICPNAIETLIKIYRDITHAEEKITYTQIAFACRNIIQEFTDSIYKPEYLPKDKAIPKKSHTKNKLQYTFQAFLSDHKKTERKLLEIQLDYYMQYLDKLNDLIQKDIHPEKNEVLKEDANRVIIYTYLFLGDVIKLLF